MWMQTYSSKRFFPFMPDINAIDINDIAHSLSLICRFNGHCNFHYSVAQHSISVAEEVAKVKPVWGIFGLLHDAAEAYIGDWISPVKKDIYVATHNGLSMVTLDEMEDRLMFAIASHFKLPYPFPEAIAKADIRVCCTEMMQIMNKPPEPWAVMRDVIPADINIIEQTSRQVRARFIEKFYDYMKLVH